jgi:hypothetical protein
MRVVVAVAIVSALSGCGASMNCESGPKYGTHCRGGQTVGGPPTWQPAQSSSHSEKTAPAPSPGPQLEVTIKEPLPGSEVLAGADVTLRAELNAYTTTRCDAYWTSDRVAGYVGEGTFTRARLPVGINWITVHVDCDGATALAWVQVTVR